MMRSAAGPGSRAQLRRTSVGIAAGLALAAGSLVGTQSALADGPTTFSNVAVINVPATGSANQTGPADPYPSNVTVSGMSGVVTAVKVTLTGVTHGALNDIDAMLVSPTGENLVFLSDIGDPNQLATASNATYTFDDAAANSMAAPPSAVASGTYKPTNLVGAHVSGDDAFPGPAPAPSAQTTLAGAFSGINPNGTWKLYVNDDTTGDVGSIAGGWSLSITTNATAVSTSTVVTTSGTPSTTGTSVDFTATVTAGGSPVASGTVQFADGTTNLGSPISLNPSGQATLTTSALGEGTHTIVATFSGASGALTSNGSVSQRVDNATVVTGDTFCNTGTITPPANGAAQPYPSHITVSGLSGQISSVTAALKDVGHTHPPDLDVLLAAPTATNNVVLLSDVGGDTTGASGVNLTFSDAATDAAPSPLVSGTYKPTNLTSETADTYPAPAPAPSGATAMSTFNGSSPNGQWSLYVVDDATGDTGEINGGWCLTISTTTPATIAVSKSWIVDGTTYANGSQPPALSAALTLDSTAQAWSTARSGLDEGDSVAINETASVESASLCEITSSRVTKLNGAAVDLALPYTATLAAGANTVEITNTATCPSRLTLTATVRNGPALATGWTLNATAPGGALAGPSGASGATGVITPLTTYPLTASGGDSRYIQQVGVGAVAIPGSTISWQCRQVNPTTGDTVPGFADGLNGGVTIPRGFAVVCDARFATAQLTLVKTVTNDNGGTAVPAAWTLSASGLTTITGATGATAVKDAWVKPGTYTLSESGPAGYSAGSWSCTAGTLTGNSLELAGEDSATCTINNDDQPAHLTLVKTVTSGSASPAAWMLKADGPTTISGTTGSGAVTNAQVNAGTYTLSESGGPGGYTAGSWSCTAGTLTGSSLALTVGQSATCTITNALTPSGGGAQPPAAAPTGHLTLVKSVVNDNGGLALPTAWTLSASGPTNLSGVTGSAAVTNASVSAGTYTLSESGGPGGYVAGRWVCNGVETPSGAIAVSAGQSVTCTIVNDDVAGSVPPTPPVTTTPLPPTAHLTLVKRVTNDDGGTATPKDWTLRAKGPARVSGVSGSPTVTSVVVPPGRYVLRQVDGPQGYRTSDWTCSGIKVKRSAVVIPAGANIVCTSRSNDKRA